jgi:hypothetical protein
LYVITAIITPDGGPIADIALFVPMAVLLELAVLIGKRYERKGIVLGRLSTAMKPVYVKCRFCGALLDSPSAFCLSCGKSQI